MLEDFTETINPDNRHLFIDIDDTDCIIIGGSATHYFELPFLFSSYAKSGSIIYKQGSNVILDISITSDMLSVKNNCSVVKLDLGPIQTQLFTDTLLDTYVQVKIITQDDEIYYDNPHYIKVISPLRVDKIVG